MQLSNLYFNYAGVANKFTSLDYTFSVPIDSATLSTIKSDFATLKSIIEREIGVTNPRKMGKVNRLNFQAGLEYDVDMDCEPTCEEDEMCTNWIQLQYNIELEGKKPTSAKIDLSHNSINGENILKLYDAILAIPGLETKKAKVDMEKIFSLRNGTMSIDSILGKTI